MKKASTKKSKKKISGKTEKQVQPTPEQVDISSLSDIKIARLIQEELIKVIEMKNEIEKCQQNVWRLNGVLDERESYEKAPDEPRNKSES